MATQAQAASQIECDLLVIGSGAGGLSAAVTAAWHGLKVIVAEKEPVLGGTTAWSGGWMWAPWNPVAQRAGIVEQPEAPRAYLRHVLGNNFDAARVDAFLAAAPRMVAFFEQNTALQFEGGNKITDTYGDAPGAGTGGRSVIAAPYDARGLGELVGRLRRPMRETTFMGMTIQAGPDLAAFMNVTRSPRAFAHAAGRFGRHLIDLAVHRRGMQVRNGLALVGRLLRSAADLGVELRTSSPAVRLLQEGGSVCGAVLGTPKGDVEFVRARGVVLAAGGFPHDHAPRRAHVPADEEHLRSRRPRPPATDCASASRWAAGRRHARRTRRLVPGVAGAVCRRQRWAASRTSSSAASPASSACSRTGGVSATRATATTTMSPPCCAPCPPGRRSRPGWSARAPSSAATAWASRGRRRCRWGRTSAPAISRPGRTIAELARNCGIDPEGLERTVADYNRARPQGRGSGVRPRHDALQPLQRRSGQHAQSLRRADRARPVLRGEGRARQLRHLRRAEDRCQRPRAGRAAVRRSRGSMRPAPTWRASWAATIPPAASISARR